MILAYLARLFELTLQTSIPSIVITSSKTNNPEVNFPNHCIPFNQGDNQVYNFIDNFLTFIIMLELIFNKIQIHNTHVLQLYIIKKLN